MEQREWKVEFSWIKAHAAHRGNELADQLANRAARPSKGATLESQRVQSGVN